MIFLTKNGLAKIHLQACFWGYYRPQESQILEKNHCQENHTFLGQKENTLWRFYAAHIPAGTEY